jgi:hypothetical protein
MLGQEGKGLTARHLLEVISCLENCEQALSRARDDGNGHEMMATP